MEILYKSSQIRKRIRDVLAAQKGRRVLISAFVGEGAEAFIPHLDGVEVVCWPNPSGTNPRAIRKLISKKAKVFFADRLHMKVYWSAQNGVVITSANLSKNALGSGDLKEAGVFLPKGELDIKKMLSIVNPRPVTKAELLALERAYNAFSVKHRRTTSSSKGTDFKEWYTSAFRTPWLLGWSDSGGEFAREAVEIAREEYDVKKPYWFIAGRKGDFSEGDWILTFTLKNNGVTELQWMYTDRVIRVSPSDKQAYSRSYPFQAVQMRTGSFYPKPPFVTDGKFLRAFSKAVQEFGPKNITRLASLNAPVRLVKSVLKAY